MALALALGSHAANRLTRGMHANLSAIEHLDPSDIEGMRRARAYDLHKGGDANAHQLALLAFLLLLFSKLVVTNHVQRFFHIGLVVATIVAPAQRRLVRESRRLNKVPA